MIQPKTEYCGLPGNLAYDALPPLLRKLVYLQSLNPEEIDLLLKMHATRKTFAKGKVLLKQGDIHKDCFIVTHGWAYRYADLYDGSRQIINYYLPGDIINPFALAMPTLNYSVAAITPLRVSICKPGYLMELFSTQSRLSLFYAGILGREDSSMAEQIVRIGRRSAYQRAAHLLLELYYRLKIVGLTEEHSFYLPVTQNLLADTLGLSVVHMNRTLYRLRLANLIKIRSHHISLVDIEKLKQVAEYKGTYLEQIKNVFDAEAKLVPVQTE
ncbi:MAG: Crp/Fnr family transcriptional regulator [Nitrosomonas sp.]|nr:MAG: Crp/Fnr family transcriptional regulator [Nitrosomonas sp.]